ncbi:MAG: hypothetical protein WDZ94_02780 [Patescibacteria group bacterium]
MIKKLHTFITSHQLIVLLCSAFILVSVRFLPFYFNQTLFFGDNFSLMVPGKIFTAQWLLQGILPLWNPYIFSGLPWIGDINQSVLYPSTLLFMFFSPAVALNILIVVHYLLTAVGMFFLSKLFLKQIWQQYLAAFFWMLSTQIAGSTHNFSTLQSLTWLPWIAWLGWHILDHRTARLLFAMVVLLQFLGGYPQHVLLSIGYAVLISGWRLQKKKQFLRWMGSWTETAIYTLIISAVAWIPFVQLLWQSTRMDQSLEQAQVGSLHPAMLIKPLAPYFFDSAVAGMKWGPAWSGQPNVVFVVTLLGITGVALSFLFWKKWDRWMWLFASSTIVAIVFSLGEYLPGYDLIQKAVPLLRIGRYPSMLLILASVSVIFWSIRSLEYLRFFEKYYKYLVITVLASCVVLTATYYLAVQNPDLLWNFLNQVTQHRLSASAFHTLERDAVIARVISGSLAVSLLFFIGSLWLYYKKKFWILVLVLSVEMVFSTQGMFLFAENSVYPTFKQIESNRQQLPVDVLEGRSRVLTRNTNMPYTDFGTYWEALVVRDPFSDSFIDEVELQEHNVLKQLQQGYTPNWNMVYGVHLVHGYTTLLPRDYSLIWKNSDEVRINFIDYIDVENSLLSDWAVKYYLVDEWFEVREDLSQFPVVDNTEVYATLELNDVASRFRFQSDDELILKQMREDPNKVVLEFAETISDQTLLLADRYDESVRARDEYGKQLVVQNFEGMRAIELPAGSKYVEVYYYPAWFFRSAFISVAGIIFCFVYCILHRRQLSRLFE